MPIKQAKKRKRKPPKAKDQETSKPEAPVKRKKRTPKKPSNQNETTDPNTSIASLRMLLDDIQGEATEKAKEKGYTQTSATLGIASKISVLSEVWEAWRFYRSEVTPEVKTFAEKTIGHLLFHLCVYASDMGINLQDAFSAHCPDFLPKRMPLDEYTAQVEKLKSVRHYADSKNKKN